MLPDPDYQPSAGGPDDAELARMVTEGDTTAEAELCHRVLPRARAWGLKYLRDEAAALDLAQHVSLTLLEALRAGRVAEPDRIGAFLLGVCKRTVLAWRGGARRRAELLERFGPSIDVSAVPDEGTVDRAKLAQCFERLAPRARTLLALAFYADRSAEEIAAELGTTAGNVRVMRHRAIDQLRACVEGT
jgi:RNA polymerase sigma-70 factor (ECF subfamily)